MPRARRHWRPQWQVTVSPAYTGFLNWKVMAEARQPICPPISVSRLAVGRPWETLALKRLAAANCIEMHRVVVAGKHGAPDYRLLVITRGLPAFQPLYHDRLSKLPSVRRLTSTLVMARVIQDRSLPLGFGLRGILHGPGRLFFLLDNPGLIRLR